jgi:predicted RNase H-like HicB family nuclease
LMATMTHRLRVEIRREDGAYWATVDDYPGVFATGDDLEELRASLEEGICLMEAGPDEDVPSLRLSKLRRKPGKTTADADLTAV